ncbi:MAG: hypothetical protein ACI85K_003680 [Hyphomicrobiaceae bacterium]|jgi:hypothetical protein
MQPRKNTDQFDDFRRERKRVRAKLGPQQSVLGYENSALRELELQEAEEVRDQQLTREVHDFFAAATRQAAAIVEKVSHDAEEQACERMQGEVQGFLMDTLSRMNGFIMTVMQQRQNVNVAETHVEPDVKHLVGSELDEFRYEGSPEVRDAHIGQDPFATPLEDVQREFRAVVADRDGEQQAPESIDGHLVAEVCDGNSADRMAAEAEGNAMLAESRDEQPAPAQSGVTEQSARDDANDGTHSEIGEDEPEPTIEEELETFKGALKALVRQGVMQREEARAAWNARLQAIGRAV